MATARALKFADQRTKDIVVGYCKSAQTILTSKHPDNSFYLIPIHITNICLAYYFIIEQFIECGNEHIQITNQRRTIYNPPTGYWDTAYGTFEIDCNDEINKNAIFRWTFDIENNGNYCNAIGIDETKRKWVNDHFKIQEDTSNYSYIADGQCYESYIPLPHGPKYKNGDRIIMELNMMDKTLIYYKYKQSDDIEKKSKSESIACKVTHVGTKDVKYCLAVYLWQSGEITLTDFEIRSA